MTQRRIPVIAAVVLAVLGLARLDDPHPFGSDSSGPAGFGGDLAAVAAKLGSSVDPTSATSTWYCPAAGAGTATPPVHQVIITNAGDATTARVTGYRAGSDQSAAIEVELGRAGQTVVVATDIAPDVLGVTVEIDGPAGSVAHRLVTPSASDQSDCLTRASDEWHFPAASTELGSTARLWLLNPFPTDASVDVSVVTEDGVRVPKALRGVIIPAASSRMLDIGDAGQRRVQFAFSVRSRGGRVVAELAQTVAGSGLRLEPGVGAAAPKWVFADSFGGAGVTDQIVVYNPGLTDASVAVSVVPSPYDRGAQPEPFVLDVGARRFAAVRLDTEARVSPDARRWIGVESLGTKSGTTPGVVAVEIVRITGPGGDGTVETRPTVTRGLASSLGSEVAATAWTVSSVDTHHDGQSAVVVVNPSPDTIALVTVATITAGKQAAVSVKPIEIPPMGVLPIDLTQAATTATVSVGISSPTPIIVAARTTSRTVKDLAMWAALPSVNVVSRLASLTGG